MSLDFLQAAGSDPTGTICIPAWALTSVFGGLVSAVVYERRRNAKTQDRLEARLDAILSKKGTRDADSAAG